MVGNIYVYLDGVQVGNINGDPVPFDKNTNGISTTTNSFDFNIGPRRRPIQYNLFFGGRECAINTVVGAAASPLCLVNEDNFVPNQVYPSVLLLSAFLRIRVWW